MTARPVELTLEQAIDRIGIGRFQRKLLLVAGASWAADAMEVLLIACAIPSLIVAWGLSITQAGLLGTALFAELSGRERRLHLSLCRREWPADDPRYGGADELLRAGRLGQSARLDAGALPDDGAGHWDGMGQRDGAHGWHSGSHAGGRPCWRSRCRWR
jgi:hypothetical protein